MPCADPAYSCNSLLTIRSPLGEVRLHASAPTPPRARAQRVVCVLRAAVEAFALARLRSMAREIDQRAIDELAVSNPAAARELRKLFGL